MPEKRKVAPVQQGSGTVIYLGPEIPGVVSAGMILNNGMTKRMEDAVEELPALKRLFVPAGDAVRAKKEMKKEVSAMKECYRQAAAYAGRKGER